MKKSLINDVTLDDDDLGPAIIFPNPEIRKMMELADVGPRDVFYDLGCGWGQNLIIALTEYHVKKAVGLENDSSRHEVACKRIKKLGLSKRCNILKENLEKALRGKVKGVDLQEATVVFYGLSTSSSLLENLRKRLSRRCRLIYYYNCLFPEIMPVSVEYPFLVSIVPFKKPKSESAWLMQVTGKKRSSLQQGESPSVNELWDELRHDHDVVSTVDDISHYRQRLKTVLRKRK